MHERGKGMPVHHEDATSLATRDVLRIYLNHVLTGQRACPHSPSLSLGLHSVCAVDSAPHHLMTLRQWGGRSEEPLKPSPQASRHRARQMHGRGMHSMRMPFRPLSDSFSFQGTQSRLVDGCTKYTIVRGDVWHKIDLLSLARGERRPQRKDSPHRMLPHA
jgi:hypothetical protein